MMLALWGPRRPMTTAPISEGEIIDWCVETRPVGFHARVSAVSFAAPAVESPSAHSTDEVDFALGVRVAFDIQTDSFQQFAFRRRSLKLGVLPVTFARPKCLPQDVVPVPEVTGEFATELGAGFAFTTSSDAVVEDGWGPAMFADDACLAVCPVDFATLLVAPQSLIWTTQEISRPRTGTLLPAIPWSEVRRIELGMDLGAEQPVALHIPPPKGRSKILTKFHPQPLNEAAEHSRRAASQTRTPDDPFANLFWLLLAKKNWDLRVQGLSALLRAYPGDSKPFGFQYAGIDFLVNRNRALLADEMGLGKTVQAILALRAGIHGGKFERVLIVCPKSLLATWYCELARWAPELSIVIVHGPDKYDKMRQSCHVYITNFESVERVIVDNQRGRVPANRFDLLIIDEAQNLKNPNTQKARAAAAVVADCRWALTGTPLENSFDDYRAVWRAIDPVPTLRQMTPDQFLRATRPNVLRREKNDVLRDLPSKSIELQFVDLEGAQREYYLSLEAQAQRSVLEIAGRSDFERSRMHIFTLLTELKKACVYHAGSGVSAKMEWVEERLAQMHPVGVRPERCEKALVFSQFPKLIWDDWRLPQRIANYRPMRYDSAVSDADRRLFAQKFQEEELCRVAFLGLKSGGTGLTLTRANHVIFLDSWWNPALMEQAAARVHRIGQERRCVVTSLIARNTIDERIERILSAKRGLFERTMQEIRDGKRDPGDVEKLESALTMDDVLEALGLQRRDR